MLDREGFQAMIRDLFLALLLFASAPALADDASVLEQMRALCPDRAKHAKRLEELIGFEGIYNTRREKLANQAKMLKNERALIMREQTDVNEACKSRPFKSKREYVEANTRCKELRKPYSEKVEQYQQDQLKQKEDVAKLDKDEAERTAIATQTAANLEQVRKQLSDLATQITDAAKKTCAIACNDGPAAPSGQCIQDCIDGKAAPAPAPAPAPEATPAQ